MKATPSNATSITFLHLQWKTKKIAVYVYTLDFFGQFWKRILLITISTFNQPTLIFIAF